MMPPLAVMPHAFFPGLVFVLFVLFVVVFVVILWLDVEDHLRRVSRHTGHWRGLDIVTYLQGLLVHRDLTLKPSKIKVVLDELLRDFGKVFMAEERAEGRYPRLRAAGGC